MTDSFTTTYNVRIYQSDEHDETEYVFSKTLPFAACNDLAKSASLSFGRAVIMAHHGRRGEYIQTAVVSFTNGIKRVIDAREVARTLQAGAA